MSAEEEMDKMKERILDNYERLNIESKFTFSCGDNLPCFTRCCGDVNIVLSPYDVLRLKLKLGISSTEFLDKYTVLPFTKEQQLPIPLLRMNEDDNKRCFFVTDEGCQVYDDRPWPCRMYPVGMASAEGMDGKSGEDFYFMMGEDDCDGIGTGKEWTIKEWTRNQGIDDYNEFGDMFKKLTLHPFFQQGGALPPKKIEMFHMCLYDLDRFRSFLFDMPGFFERFEVQDWVIERMKTSDSEVLRFAFTWLRFALFGEDTVAIRPEVAEKVKKAQEATKE
jgi:uncharacterized protein